MRYRKRIKIAPGVNINLSGSGISATVGPRGANVNLGKKGAYLNTGIPGTGLYNRTKISKSKIKSTQNQSTKNHNSQVELDLDEDYLPVVKIYDYAGIDVTSPTTINKLKRTPAYKENLKKIYKRYYDLIQEETRDFTELHKHTLPPITQEEVENKIKNLKSKKYTRQTFNVPKPTKDTIEKALKEESIELFNSLWFWKNQKNRRKFVTENLESRLEKSIKDWEKAKKAQEDNTKHFEKQFNIQQEKQIKEEKELLQHNIEGKEYVVLNNFQDILNEIEIKPEFHVDFTYDENNRTFFIDLDLPEIEDLPKEKSSLLKSGKLSVKEKSDKILREEYAICVTGLAFLISGVAFMSAAGIEKVKISGYTQRLDKATGITNDDYIYSIVFDREKFRQINYPEINPIYAFDNFENDMNLSKTLVFKSIDIA